MSLSGNDINIISHKQEIYYILKKQHHKLKGQTQEPDCLSSHPSSIIYYTHDLK